MSALSKIYEQGGWSDGRLGEAYDLIAAVLETRGELNFRNPILQQIEAFDQLLKETGEGVAA